MRAIFLFSLAAGLAQAQSGKFTIHMILHSIGEEQYSISQTENGLALHSTFEYSDRGNKRTTAVTLEMDRDYTPRKLEIAGRPESVKIENGQANISESTGTRSGAAPERFFTTFGPSPFAVQSAMMRYWVLHGKAKTLPVLRASAAADPLQIEPAGQDAITVDRETV